MRRWLALLVCALMALGSFTSLAEGTEPQADPVEAAVAEAAGDELSTDQMRDADSQDVPKSARPKGSSGLKISKACFPDAAFRKYVKSVLDGDGDGYLSKKECAAVKVIGLDKQKIADLTGIERFPNLVTLSVKKNKLKSIDLSGNKKLKELDVSGNQLEKLNLRKNKALTTVVASKNALTSVNVTACSKLKTLNVSDNRLETLDVSKNRKLTALYCEENWLETLDVSKNTALKKLRCTNNLLERLDVRNNAALTELLCHGNGFGIYDVANLPETMYKLIKGKSTFKTSESALSWSNKSGQRLTLPGALTLTEGAKILYGKELLLDNLYPSKVRADFPELSDEQYANFRPVLTTGMGGNVLYRSSSPIRMDLNRQEEAAAAMAAANIRTVLNISDSEDEMREAEGYPGSLYAALDVCAIHCDTLYWTRGFEQDLATLLRYMIDHPGPYLVHCLYGRDRTGFVCAILECLMGASAEEVVADYMQSFVNFNDLEPGSEAYAYIADQKIVAQLGLAFGLSSLSGADLQYSAQAYLERIGLSSDEIEALRQRLS